MNEENPAANIMIVDDEPENLNVLEALLTQSGYRVSAFPRGELALAAASLAAPDLVLLDVRMPGLDGHEVCRRFKAHEGLRDIPILFISAFRPPRISPRAWHAAASITLPNPFANPRCSPGCAPMSLCAVPISNSPPSTHACSCSSATAICSPTCWCMTCAAPCR